jgi:hypothetical protein
MRRPPAVALRPSPVPWGDRGEPQPVVQPVASKGGHGARPWPGMGGPRQWACGDHRHPGKRPKSVLCMLFKAKQTRLTIMAEVRPILRT